MRYTDLLFELLPPDELTEWSECWKKITQASEKIKARYGDISASDIEDTSKLFKEDEIIAPLFQEYNTAYKKAEEIENHAKELYCQNRGGNLERIKEDAKLIIESASYNAFVNFANEQALGGSLKDENNAPEKESFVMQIYLKICISLQVEALTRYGHTAETLKHFADEYIAAKIKQWQSKDFKEISTNYPDNITTLTYFEKGGIVGTFPKIPIVDGIFYNTLKQDKAEENKIDGTVKYYDESLIVKDSKNNDFFKPYVKVLKKRIEYYKTVQHSILSPYINKFLGLYSKKIQDTATEKDMPNFFSVIMNREEVYKCMGFDVELHLTGNESEKAQQNEMNRVKNARREAGRMLAEVLDTVQSFIYPFINEKVKYMDAPLIQGIKPWGDNIEILPTEAFYYEVYNSKLKRELTLSDMMLPASNPNAYYMMDKMRERWGMDKNRNRGEHNRLSVKSLLQVTLLPTYEKCRQQRASWKTRIQAPFENALNFLKDNGNIISWEYKLPGGKPISKDLLDNQGRVKDYFVWESLIVFFDIPEDEELKKQTEERIRKNTEKRAKEEEKKQERIAKAIAKAKTKTTTSCGKKPKNSKKKAVNP